MVGDDRKSLVAHLREYRPSVQPDVVTDDLHTIFGPFEHLTRGVLSSLGIHHGLSMEDVRSKEGLRDKLMLDLMRGQCALGENGESEVCVGVIRQYLTVRGVTDMPVLQILVLSDIIPRLPLRPLQRLMHLYAVAFREDVSLNRNRQSMKIFVDRLHTQLASSHSSQCSDQTYWPQIISDDQKVQLLKNFMNEMSSDSLHGFVCGCCNGQQNINQRCEVLLDDINLALLRCPDRRVMNDNVVDADCLDSDCTPPSFSISDEYRVLCDVLVVSEGLILRDGIPCGLQLCLSCHRSLQRGLTPDLSLANHMYIGVILDVLRDLTVVEEAMIVRCRAKSCIIQLRESVDGAVVNAQCVLRGHIIVFPQQPEYVMDLLPPPLEDIAAYICILFVGSRPPSQEWMHMHARPLLVHKEKVRQALMWLQVHNRFYKHVQLNNQVLDSMEDEGILPVHVDIVPTSFAQVSLLSGYTSNPRVSSMDDGVEEARNNDSDVFGSVVVANVDGNSSAAVLRAAAMEHIKKKGSHYIQIPHGTVPVGNFNNPGLLPMVFPTLFPYGLGGSEDCWRSRPVALHRHVKHLFELADSHFRTHYSFLFLVFNLVQCQKILLHSSLKVNRRSFDAFKAQFSKVSPAAV